jgi:nucleoside-diphosphate-sugar epimerase
MRYFLTGATGFIGGKITRQLLAAGHQVVALVRTPSKAADLANLGVELHPGDITDKESMRAPMRGVDGVFHIAAWYKIGERDATMAERMNVDGTRNVLELMRELEIPRGVYTSTLAVFGDTHGKVVDESYYDPGPWLSEYDRTKWLAHYKVALPMSKDGLPLVIVQPGLVYGPGDTSSLHDVWVQYLKRRLPAVPRGVEYAPAHVEDIARGHILAMERGKPGESYIIAGSRYSLIDMLALAQKVTGIPAPRLHPRPGLMRALATILGVLGKVLPLPSSLSAEYLRISAGVTYLGSNAKARRELGYNPRSLEEGLPETLKYEMEQLGMKHNVRVSTN